MRQQYMGYSEAIALDPFDELQVDMPGIDENRIPAILGTDQVGVRKFIQGEMEEYFHGYLRETRLLEI